MRKDLIAVFLLVITAGLLPVTPATADVGFGIPDMIEEKVDELDQKVREFKRQQNQFPALQPFQVATGDTSFVITDSVISRDGRKIYLLANDTSDSRANLVLSLIDGSGQIEGTNDIGGFTPQQLTLTSDGQPVVLSTISTDSGVTSQLSILDENLDGISAVPDAFLADTYTSLALDPNDDFYLSGTGGVRKLNDFGDTIWRDTGFRVPEDNIITQGDSVFITDLSETTSSNDLTLQLLALDQNDGSVDWKKRILDYSATDVAGTTYLTIGNNNLQLLLQETRSGDEFDTMFIRDFETGNSVSTRTYQTDGPASLSDNIDPIPTVVDASNNIYAGDQGGTIYKLNPSSGAVDSKLDVSDSEAIPWILDDGDSVYASVSEDTRSAVQAFGKSITPSDSTAIFFTSSDTLPVNTRPVWLTDGFLGIVFSGGRISVNETPLDGDDLEVSPWPHRYRDNQATRLRD